MADDTENHTIRLLQEMRAELRGRLDGIDETLGDMTTRINGNTITLNMLMGALYDHEERLARLEGEDGTDG